MAFSNAPQYSTYQQKRVQFYGDMDSRQNSYNANTDAIFENVYCEAVLNSYTGDKELYLRKRPGLTHIETLSGTGEIRGVLDWEGTIFYVRGNTLFEREPSGTTHDRGTITTDTGRVGMCLIPYQGDNGLLRVVISDGTSLWWYKLGTPALTTIPTGYPTPHIPQPICIDGYLILAKKDTDEFYNSQLSNIAQPWDFISAEMYPDYIQGINRYNNYVMVLGNESIEMFYDAAIESGSPFARNESTIVTVGCRSPWSAVQTDRRFYWVGTTQEGDRSVWNMIDFKPEEIGTPFIKRCLAEEADPINIHASSIRVKGRHWYVLYLTEHTFAYDIDEKKWAVWTYDMEEAPYPMHYVAEGTMNADCFLLYNGELYKCDPESGDDAGIPITCRWQTNVLDFETMNRKFLHRLTLVGNANNIAGITVTWTDDDYQTWSSPREIPMSSTRPAIVNLGYFRQRGFRFQYSGPSDLRLQAMELTYNTGVN